MIQPSHGHNGGVADTLDEAKAAFRAAAGGPSTVRPAENWSSPASAFFKKQTINAHGHKPDRNSAAQHAPDLTRAGELCCRPG